MRVHWDSERRCGAYGHRLGVAVCHAAAHWYAPRPLPVPLAARDTGTAPGRAHWQAASLPECHCRSQRPRGPERGACCRRGHAAAPCHWAVKVTASLPLGGTQPASGRLNGL